MKTKTYRVNSIREALTSIQRELGPDASILHTRRVQSGLGRWIGLGDKLEVVASADANVPSRFAVEKTSPNTDEFEPNTERFEPNEGENRFQEQDQTELNADVERSIAPVEGLAEASRERIGDDESLSGPSTSTCLEASDLIHRDQLLTELELAEFSSATRRAFIDACLVDFELGLCSREKLLATMVDQFPVGEMWQPSNDRQTRIALVGPTGAGKTTTLAKLAAITHLEQGCSIGFITVDTFRIGAIEQIQTYANILGSPVHVVRSPGEMADACRQMRDAKVIFIDTAGRNPKLLPELRQLREILVAAHPDEIMMVASSLSSASGFQRSMNAYGEIGVSSLIISKLDEADTVGQLWDPIQTSHLPVRYITTGQNVPRDIETIDPHKVCQRILGAEIVASPNPTDLCSKDGDVSYA